MVAENDGGCGCALGCKEDGPSTQPVLSTLYDADEEQHGKHQRQ